MERVVRRTSLHPLTDKKLEVIAKDNQRTISNQIAEFINDGVADNRYVIKDLPEDLRAEMIAAAKKENRSVENFIETAIRVHLKRVEYVKVFH